MLDPTNGLFRSGMGRVLVRFESLAGQLCSGQVPIRVTFELSMFGSGKV